MTRSSANKAFAAGGLGLAIALFLGAYNFPDRAADAARYIFFLAGTMAVLSLILFVQKIPSPDSDVRWVRSVRNFTITLVAGHWDYGRRLFKFEGMPAFEAAIFYFLFLLFHFFSPVYVHRKYATELDICQKNLAAMRTAR